MNSSALRLCLAQLNPTLGDIAGNAGKARAARAQAHQAGAELVMLPELFLSGGPLQDLALNPALLGACRAACDALARETADGGPGLLIGLPWREGEALYNAYVLLDGGFIQSVRFKVDLSKDGLFDETAIFSQGPLPGPVVFRDKVRLGLTVGQDLDDEEVAECLAETGAELLLAPAASPYRRDIGDARMNVAVARVVETGLPLAWLNQVGGQSETVFDGASLVLNGDRSLAHQLPAFRETLIVTDWTREAGRWRCAQGEVAAIEVGDEADYAAIVLALRDYVGKSGFPAVVLGLSGGVDSALCAALAVDALGPERVNCIMLPSRFTAAESQDYARACAGALGARYETLPIAQPLAGFDTALAGLFAGAVGGVAEENLQSRTRGVLLMALSNRFNWMLLTTGNKSEASVGYATLYGDMCGGYNPLGDLYKTQVLRLAALRNRWKPAGALGPDGVVIPPGIIARPPSAELREGQTDQDSLPPYEVLDAILHGLVEQRLPVSAIAAQGHDRALVAAVARLVKQAAFKRRQAAPGVRIGPKAVVHGLGETLINGFTDSGDAPYEPDAALLKGIIKPSTDSFDF